MGTEWAGMDGGGFHGTPPEKDAKGRRLYPFRRPLSPPPSTTSNLMAYSGTITTYEPNPFHGIDRWAFAVDEWFHRHGLGVMRCEGKRTIRSPWWAYLGPGRFCDWWDRRIAGEDR